MGTLKIFYAKTREGRAIEKDQIWKSHMVYVSSWLNQLEEISGFLETILRMFPLVFKMRFLLQDLPCSNFSVLVERLVL